MLALIIVSILFGVLVGWAARSDVARKERRVLKVKARDQIILDGFEFYREKTGELHPEDPRNVRLKVVDISQNGGL